MQQQRSRRQNRSQTVQFAQINYLQLKQLEYNGNWPQNVRKSLKIKQSRNFVEYLVESEGRETKGLGIVRTSHQYPIELK